MTLLRPLFVLPACSLLLLVGCSRGKTVQQDDAQLAGPEGMGFHLGLSMGNEGNIEFAGAGTYRKRYERRISNTLGGSLGRGWKADVTIAPDPRYVDPTDTKYGQNDPTRPYARGEQHKKSDGWYWRQATITVNLVGDGTSPEPSLEAETVKEFVGRIMEDKLAKGAPLLVTVTAAIDPTLNRPEDRPRTLDYGDSDVVTVPGSNESQTAVAPTAPAAPATPVQPATPTAPVETVAPAPTPVTPAPTAAGQTVAYQVQAGDTLATISMVFYGTPNHWQAIVAANPGLTPAGLKPGMAINVPMKP
jgi:LysM repeat protein